MTERNRTRLTQAARSKARSRSIVFGPLSMVLFVLSIVTGISFVRTGHSHASAAPQSQNLRKELRPPMVASFDHQLVRASPPLDHFWREPERGLRKSGAKVGALPTPYRELWLDEAAQREFLRRAPIEFTKAAKQTEVVMTLPLPDGTVARFRVEESPVMAPRLAALFPSIKTYRGRGLDDPNTTCRFDVTPAGFHAIVLSTRGTFIVEPAEQGRAGQYVSYDSGKAPAESSSLSCLFSETSQSFAQLKSRSLYQSANRTLGVTTGTTLRTYRLALAATAEYTATYGGGTVSGGLSALTTTINAVNAIYERDLSIRLQLIDNETSIIFTNSSTDGYTSDNVSVLLSQNQTNLDQRIGSANYDIGFVLDGRTYLGQPGRFLFQGQGQFQSACVNGQKGKGVAILRSMEPSTISAIYDVGHEIGHQFGALHTFNGTTEDCGPSRFAQVAYEPGSGSTIMAYRGGVAPSGTYLPICTFEDLHSTDTYFHAASIDQIVSYTTQGNGGICPLLTDTGNQAPVVTAGPDYTIPAGTPFTLTASASDPEADALTYCWEEFDLGAPGPPHTDNGNRPIFRSFAPVPSPARTFPQLADILSGTATFGESLPVTTRSMNFRVTVRDNHSGGGAVNTGAMWVNVSASSGPFAVTQPGSGTTWQAGSSQTVTWDVANTSGAPVNCGNVRIRLSIDGGSSFPFTLAASTANTGTAVVNVPNAPTLNARVKVEAVDNIFFNISRPNFTITPNNTAAPTLLTVENTNRAMALDSVTFIREPFPQITVDNFSSDLRTRLVLFAFGLELAQGEDLSVVTAQAEDAGHVTYPLKVEYVGKVPGFDWLSQIVVRLPDDSLSAGDLLVSVSLRGAASNKVLIRIR